MQFLAPFFRDVRRFSSRRIQKRGSSCFALLAATLALAGATATAMPAYAAGGFDYEILQPDDNCLIQLEAEDPPLQDMCFGTAASGSGFQSCLSAGGNVAIGPAGIVCWNSGAARPTNATRQKYADEDFPAMGACLKKGKSVTFKSKKVGCVGTPAEILRVVGVK